MWSLQFAPQLRFSGHLQVGNRFSLPVSVNGSGEYVTLADIELSFDSAVLRAVECRAGQDAVSADGFECRFNIFGNLDSVQVSYVDSGAAAQWDGSADDLFDLATVDFEVCPATCTAAMLDKPWYVELGNTHVPVATFIDQTPHNLPCCRSNLQPCPRSPHTSTCCAQAAHRHKTLLPWRALCHS